jgi:hypothetical protein
MEKPDVQAHYALSKISYTLSVWNDLAPSCYAILETKEPVNISNLDNLLKIVLNSSISDNDIAKLASSKSMNLVQPEHIARWFAVWTSVEPLYALPSLEKHLNSIATSKESTSFAIQFILYLLGPRLNATISRNAFKAANFLKHIHILMHKYIRVDQDIHRPSGTVFPLGLRDDAQDARNSLIELIQNIPGKETYFALTEIAKAHPKENYKTWFMRLAKDRAEMDADIIEPWSPQQLLDFHENLDRTPNNHQDLAELAYRRLLDLKDNLENGDDSIAGTLLRIELEPEMRKFIGRELREKASGRYGIPQEEELADAKKTDLRFHGMGFDAPVPVELKLAQKWSGPELFERMENQLCRDYLRDHRSSHGIFLLVHQGKRNEKESERNRWQLPDSKKRVCFDELIFELENYWGTHLSPKFPNISDIHVVGIDLTKRSATNIK